MDLQYALLLIGVLIIGGVALSAYDKLRFDWGRRTNFDIFGLRRRRDTGDPTEKTQGSVPAPRPNAHFSGLDLNPAAPLSETDQKYLRPDAEMGPATERSADYYLYQELRAWSMWRICR